MRATNENLAKRSQSERCTFLKSRAITMNSFEEPFAKDVEKRVPIRREAVRLGVGILKGKIAANKSIDTPNGSEKDVLELEKIEIAKNVQHAMPSIETIRIREIDHLAIFFGASSQNNRIHSDIWPVKYR